jgi:putative transposase
MSKFSTFQRFSQLIHGSHYNMLRKNRHSVYDLEYHLVVVTKYRHPVLSPDVTKRLVEISHSLFEEMWSCYISEINTADDHIHILFEAPPQCQLSKLINNYKTVSSRLLRKEFAEFLAPYYWKPYFWSNSYFIVPYGQKSTIKNKNSIVRYFAECARRRERASNF